MLTTYNSSSPQNCLQPYYSSEIASAVNVRREVELLCVLLFAAFDDITTLLVGDEILKTEGVLLDIIR